MQMSYLVNRIHSADEASIIRGVPFSVLEIQQWPKHKFSPSLGLESSWVQELNKILQITPAMCLEKWTLAKDLNRHLSKEDTQMTNKDIKDGPHYVSSGSAR